MVVVSQVDVLRFLPRTSLIDFQCGLGLPCVCFNLSLWYWFLAAFNTVDNLFLYVLQVSRNVIGHFCDSLPNLCFSLMLFFRVDVMQVFVDTEDLHAHL